MKEKSAMQSMLSRRQILATTALLPLVGLAGCATDLRYRLTEVIRRLLTLSSQRAFARLLAPDGFLGDELARVTLPDALGGNRATTILQALLLTGPVRERLLKQVNRAAARASERAAPMVADAILKTPFLDAEAIVRGGPEAATSVLRQQMGDALLTALVPGADEGLRLFDNQVVTDVLKLATGIDFAALRDDVAHKTSDSIYRAIGREEAAIRANPSETNDPMLIAIFGLVK
jgi:transcriptional regulator with AAA-type ATPase domain